MKKRRTAPKSNVDFGTTEEWIQDLQELCESLESSDTEGYLSTGEIVSKTGYSRDRVLQMLNDARDKGCLETKNRTTVNIAGRKARTPVYKILKK